MRKNEFNASYNAYHDLQDSLKKIDQIKEGINNRHIMAEKMKYIDSLFDSSNPDNEKLLLSDMDENGGIFIALSHMDEEKLLSDLLKAADKNGVAWCQKVVSLAEDKTIVSANKLLSKEARLRGYSYMPISGVYLDLDLSGIKMFYEYSISSRDSKGYREHQHIRDEYREALFNMIADGKTLYSYEELKEFHDYPQDKQKSMINCSWDDWVDRTNVFETDGYKRAMRRIEYEILRHENKELFNNKDFGKLHAEQKDLILEFTDSKDVAKAVVDTYKGNTKYTDLIAKHFTKDEFEKIVEDYEITKYRRENEQLKSANVEISKNMEQLKVEVREEKESLASRESEVSKAKARVDAKEKELGFLKDIPIVCQGSQKEVDAFTSERKKELFDKMKKEMTANANLRENHLTGMCKIYTSKTNTPEEKAEYFKDLHQIRKSGKTNAEKREMAATFDRVLGRNPDLAKDEALKGLAKVDYSAIGYTPTKRGFSKNDGGRTEK